MSLPSGYKQLEYIQSSGTQYIDTGFKPNQNTRIKMDCNVIGFNSGDAFLFGARIASGNTAFCLAADDVNTRWFALYGNAVQNPTGTCTGKHSIDFNQNVLTLDGKNFTFEKTTFQSSYNLLLFATITNGNVDSQRGKMAIYSCQIYDNVTLIRDYIPCQTISGEIGLWDDVNSVFYGNAGTGSFVAGAEVKGSHKTLIDGTAYVVKGGRDLIAGTGYAKKQGKTLIDGTAYKIGFSRTVTITITGDGGGGRELTSVTIDGVKYIRTATVEAITGTEIVCYAANGGWNYGEIYLNGTVVARGSSHGGARYTYIVKSDMEIKIQTDMWFTGSIYLTTK